MREIVHGRINGTGSALYVGIGFVPDWVTLWNLEDGGGLAPKLRWNRLGGTADQEEGVLMDSTNKRTELTHGAGVAIYESFGTKFATTQTAYLHPDPSPEKKAANTSADPIDTWALDTSGSMTGHWNAGCNTTYVGEGSRILICQSVNQRVLEAAIVALSNDGDASDEVTLDRDVQSGIVLSLSGFATHVGITSAYTMPDGFTINEASDLNQSGELIYFEAGRVQ